MLRKPGIAAHHVINLYRSSEIKIYNPHWPPEFWFPVQVVINYYSRGRDENILRSTFVQIIWFRDIPIIIIIIKLIKKKRLNSSSSTYVIFMSKKKKKMSTTTEIFITFWLVISVLIEFITIVFYIYCIYKMLNKIFYEKPFTAEVQFKIVCKEQYSIIQYIGIWDWFTKIPLTELECRI